jgi:hypothetical protein
MTKIPSVEERVESLRVTSILETYEQYLERVRKIMQQDRLAILTEPREYVDKTSYYDDWDCHVLDYEKVQAHLDEIIKSTK